MSPTALALCILHVLLYRQRGTSIMKTVDQLLEQARNQLPARLSHAEVLRAHQSGALVVDIRGDEQQRRDGLIPNTLVIRRNVLEWRCDPTSEWHHPAVTSHDLHIILVCDEGYQSSLAAANLHTMGLRRATDMEGGFQSWRALGFPVVPYGRGSILAEGLLFVVDRLKGVIRPVLRQPPSAVYHQPRYRIGRRDCRNVKRRRPESNLH